MKHIFNMKNVNGHIEVYDEGGVFIFSADTEMEAEQDLELFFAA